MKKGKTNRGFRIYHFIDCYGDDCSMQKSSNAEHDHIWLGLDRKEVERHPATGGSLGVRMLVDRKLAATLSLKLAAFSETGEI